MTTSSEKLHWLSSHPKATVFAVMVVLMIGYFSRLVMADSSFGATPGEEVAGKLQVVYQRAMGQYCTGVLETKKSIWLVGRLDGDYTGGVRELGPDFDTMPELGTPHRSSFFSNDPVTSIISRLNEQGTFEVVATLSGNACLASTPSGETVLLLTELDQPRPNDGTNAPLSQSVILRSDDQGKTWLRLQDGLFPAVSPILMNPSFSADGSAWVYNDSTFDGPGSVFFSSDLGSTVQGIALPQSMRLSRAELAKRIPEGTRVAESFGDDFKGFVHQVGDDLAIAWTTQAATYARPEAGLTEGRVCTTSSLAIHRVGSRWQPGAVKRDFGYCLKDINKRATSNELIAVLEQSGGNDKIATFNAARQEWRILGEAPNPFWPFPADRRVRKLRVGEHSIVLDVMADHTMPSPINFMRGTKAQTDANASFYSVDNGRTWTRLGLPGYLGVMGLSPDGDRVYGSPLWFDNPRPDVRVFHLDR